MRGKSANMATILRKGRKHGLRRLLPLSLTFTVLVTGALQLGSVEPAFAEAEQYQPTETIHPESSQTPEGAIGLVDETPLAPEVETATIDTALQHNPDFASQNLNKYFSLAGSSTSSLWKAHIRRVFLTDSGTNASSSFQQNQTPSGSTWIATELDVPAGRTPAPNTGGTLKRNPNALGVTEDGVFYFTMQYQQAEGTSPQPKHEFIDVWRYESGVPTGTGTELTRVVSGMDLGPTASGSAEAQQIVAGAVNSFDGAFYFGFYSPVGDAASGHIELHLYRASEVGGTWSAGRIGTAATPKGSYLAGTNGDFVFDTAGNLTFVVSDQGHETDAYIGTIPHAELAEATIENPKTFTDFSISPRLPIRTGANNGQVNGIVFTRTGLLSLEVSLQGRQILVNPNTFDPSSISSNNVSAGVSAPVTASMFTDTASFASPPTVELAKHVVERIDPPTSSCSGSVSQRTVFKA